MKYAIRIAEYNLDRPAEPVRVTWTRRRWYGADGKTLEVQLTGFEWPRAQEWAERLRSMYSTRMTQGPVSFVPHISVVPV